MTVLEYLRENRISINAPCGGNGTCGKCRVSIDGGEPVPACRTEYRKGMVIEVPDKGNTAILGAESGDIDIEGHIEVSGERGRGRKSCGIAIDIGTTTIAGVLCDAGSGKILANESRLNSNTSFGADVISRIRAGAEGSAEIMRNNLIDDIKAIVFKLAENKIPIDIIVLAGNTTMIHTLMGYDLSSLGVFPYEPVNISVIEGKTDDILDIRGGSFDNTGCVIFPGVSSYVGGDIVSGLYHLESIRTPDTYAFIDLGTNGEMAVAADDNIYAASTSAGPVFEGGGISCGVGSVTGAIDHVKIDGTGGVSFTTISDSKLVTGICGSGVIDCAAEIYRTGMCTERGTFRDGRPLKVARYPDMTPVSFTQEDMRQVQLAKAAIAAGLEILCRSAGITYSDIGALYLAGGMGYAMDADAAVRIGLIPAELSDKVISVGNSSLKGTMRFITEDHDASLAHISRLAEECRLIDLAADPDFQDIYILSMDLPENPFL